MPPLIKEDFKDKDTNKGNISKNGTGKFEL